MQLANFDVEEFLKNYWQQKPCVIRQAFQQVDFLEADELAGLALEEDVESRLIQQIKGKWEVEHGPFADDKFSRLAEHDWTLLVQGVDQWVPEVQAILPAFEFLPRWRLDDVMVSFAPPGGTVSQHYDFFDVFLVQGEGKRRWQVGQVCDSSSELVPDTSVRILKEFEVALEVELEPGDILYVPARHAHLGVSLENSLTYSIGFKAPSIRDMVDGVANTALEDLLEEQRYEDTAQTLQTSGGEIGQASIALIKQQLEKALLDDELIKRYFAKAVTEPKYPDLNADCAQAATPEELEQWQADIAAGCGVFKNPASRFAYIACADKQAQLYVDSQCFNCSLALARFLADGSELNLDNVTTVITGDNDQSALMQMLEQGVIELA